MPLSVLIAVVIVLWLVRSFSSAASSPAAPAAPPAGTVGTNYTDYDAIQPLTVRGPLAETAAQSLSNYEASQQAAAAAGIEVPLAPARPNPGY